MPKRKSTIPQGEALQPASATRVPSYSDGVRTFVDGADLPLQASKSTSKINILDSSIFNLIAAGEVVERPLSVVKELVENSIDAGAARVSVDLKDKLAKITVADDGCGIEPDDMRKAFLPHATSKIKTQSDLDKIGTLGFRGEALCSIAAVARVTALSRTADSELGAKIVIENGAVLEESATGCAFGTTITVTDLFKNLPARAKFLAKPGIEEGEISNLIARLILANPQISIKYSVDGRTVYHSDGQGLKSAVEAVYGYQVVCKTAHIKSDVLEGYLGHPTLTKPSRNFGTVVVNGRYVKSPQVERAVFEAYSPYLMKHQFPLYVLHITVPLESVDVNVHPNKTEVRFADDRKLIQSVGDAVAAKVTQMSRAVAASPPVAPAVPKITEIVDDMLQSIIIEKPIIPILTAFETPTFFDITPVAPIPHTPLPYTPTIYHAPFTILCKLYNTYIVVQRGGTVYLIDQHAAHERLIFDKYSQEVKARKFVLQPLLLPYVFSLMPDRAARFMDNISAIAAAGIMAEEWGENSFRITELPQILINSNLEKLVAALEDGFGRGVNTIIEEKIIMAACKAAVKGEDDLHEDEINALLSAMDAKSPSLFCPHGRPIVVRLDKAELDKRFKR